MMILIGAQAANIHSDIHKEIIPSDCALNDNVEGQVMFSFASFLCIALNYNPLNNRLYLKPTRQRDHSALYIPN